jgi:hypothetical protein
MCNVIWTSVVVGVPHCRDYFYVFIAAVPPLKRRSLPATPQTPAASILPGTGRYGAVVHACVPLCSPGAGRKRLLVQPDPHGIQKQRASASALPMYGTQQDVRACTLDLALALEWPCAMQSGHSGWCVRMGRGSGRLVVGIRTTRCSIFIKAGRPSSTICTAADMSQRSEP